MMLLTKPKLAAVFVATVGVLATMAASFFAPMRAAHVERKPALLPAAKKPLAKKITVLADDIRDVASLLNITKEVCEVELRPGMPFTEIGVDIEIYKDGKKQDIRWSLPRFKADNFGVAKPKLERVKVAVFAADLDYLPLAGAIKKHHRVQVKMELPGATAAPSTDVPNELFDFSHYSAAGWFSLEAGSATEVPLFYMKARSNEVNGADTASEFIEKNSKGDVLIAYLRLR